MMNLEELEEKVTEIERNAVAQVSRGIYQNSSARFLKWVYVNKRHLLTQSFISSVELDSNGEPTDHSIKSILSIQPEQPPIHFEELTARDFLTWIVSLRKKDGTVPGYSSYNSHRSALFNLFRDY